MQMTMSNIITSRLNYWFKLSSGETKPNNVEDAPSDKAGFPVFGGNGVIGWSSQSNASGENIIIGRVGAKCGCVHYYKGKCWITDNALYTKEHKRDYDKRFMSVLLSYVGLERLRSKTGQPLISQGPIHSLIAAIPGIKDQQAIALLAITWDTVIEKTEKLIEAKEKWFSWLIKSLISDPCKHWEHLQTEKIFKSISEKNNGDEALLSVTQDRGVIPRTMLEGRVMSPEGSTDAYKLIREGDFAISLRSFQGGIEYSRYQGTISPAYTVLRPKLKIHDEFYRHFFKSYLFIEKYLCIAVIGIRDGKQISIPDFMTVKIPYPSLKQQKQIASVLNTARQEIDLLKKQSEAYSKQKLGLMQKLLTGKWRVKTDEGERVK